MKKVLVILLLMVYGLTSTGMTLHFHYCCGKLDKVELSPAKDAKCGMKGMVSKKTCCNDKQLELKVKSDYRGEQAAKLAFSTFATSVQHIDRTHIQVIRTEQTVPNLLSQPPPLSNPIYIFNCVYRI